MYTGGITVNEAYEMLDKNPNAVLVDVRSYQEYEEGHLER